MALLELRGPPPDETLFDDVLACLDQQYELDNRKVYAAGFSAGALWTTHLLLTRADYLAAIGIFSGGTSSLNPYATPLYDTAALLTVGGQDDRASSYDFAAGTADLSSRLVTDGHPVIVCDHCLGHTLPAGFHAWTWPFLAAHAFGDPSGYAGGGDPSGALPSYCVSP